MTIPYLDVAGPFEYLLDYGFLAPESKAVNAAEFKEAMQILRLLEQDA